MVIADTSVWVDHLRHGNGTLAALLDDGEVLAHPFVIGELACGHLKNRAEILQLLCQLPPAAEATDDETLALIEERRLMGRGIGFVDAHLLAAAALTPFAHLWTLDKRLAAVATDIGLG